MRTPEIFSLTKREQRIVIAIVLLLLAGTIALRYRDLRLNLPAPPPSPPTLAPQNDAENAIPEESP